FSYLSLFSSNDSATTEIYTLSLHDALPISAVTPELRPLIAALLTGAAAAKKKRACRSRSTGSFFLGDGLRAACRCKHSTVEVPGDRKSTRLNSSHVKISYAVFCLKKKTKNK